MAFGRTCFFIIFRGTVQSGDVGNDRISLLSTGVGVAGFPTIILNSSALYAVI